MEPTEKSVGTLLQDLTGDVSNLVRDEVRLAQAEMSEKVNQIIMAVIAIVAGLLLALVSLIILLEGVAVALANYMPDWAAVVLVGAVTAVVAFILVNQGKNSLSAARLAPNRTARNLQRDTELAREQV